MSPELWDLVLGTDEPGGVMARLAKASLCPKCDAALIHGLDDDWCALDTYADAEPLSALGEVIASIAGLRTLELRRRAGGYELSRRDHGSIKGRPAGSGRVDVLTEHRCGAVIDRAPPVLRLRRLDPSTEPPF